ncbi:MAG TPA: lipocalin family protein [Polyangiales bacterium]
MNTRRWIWGSAIGAALMLALGAQARSGFVRAFELVPEKYLGVWYEIGRTPNDFEDNLPNIAGERHGPCLDATATYKWLGDGRVAVHNVCTRAAIANPALQTRDEVSGVARIEQGSENRKLKVAFGSKAARFLQRMFTGGGADYWVYGVGPEQDGQYSWALVSGKKRDNIFILARTRELDAQQMADILALARSERLPTDRLIYTQRVPVMRLAGAADPAF